MEYETLNEIAMKIIITIVMGILLSVSAPAQTWNEVFQQKKTQKKYLVKQIALLRLYLGYVKKGYEIANKGLTTIQNIRNGEFNLHRDFFGSLKNVNPHIANSAKVADIIAFQVYVIRDLKSVKNFCRTNQNFTPEELRYVAAVYSNMLFLSDASISELLMIIRPDQTGMKDDERLMRIDKLYDDMRDKHAFVQCFDNDVRLIAKERERDQKEVQLLRKQFEVI
jgi:hypothetical protein